MAKRPGRTQPGGSGRSRNDNALGAGLGALMGGGGETAGYGEAASAVKDGVLSSPGPEYDPRAATSAHGVLTPSLQAAYDQGPFKPQNWFGKLTGQKDLAEQWTLSHAAGLDALENQKALEAINHEHQQTMQAIQHSNATDLQKQQFALQAQNTRDSKVQDVMAAAKVAPTIEAQKLYTDAQLPLVPEMAKAGSRATLNASLLSGDEAGIAHAHLSTPEGAAGYDQSMFAKDAAPGIANTHTQAATKRLGIIEAGPGTAVFPAQDVIPGSSYYNQPHERATVDLATGRPLPMVQGGLRGFLDGKAVSIAPNVPPMGGGVSRLLAPQFDPGVMAKPTSFNVPIGAGGPGATPDPTTAGGPPFSAKGPIPQALNAAYGGLQQAGQVISPYLQALPHPDMTGAAKSAYGSLWNGNPMDWRKLTDLVPALAVPNAVERMMNVPDDELAKRKKAQQLTPQF